MFWKLENTFEYVFQIEQNVLHFEIIVIFFPPQGYVKKSDYIGTYIHYDLNKIHNN